MNQKQFSQKGFSLNSSVYNNKFLLCRRTRQNLLRLILFLKIDIQLNSTKSIKFYLQFLLPLFQENFVHYKEKFPITFGHKSCSNYPCYLSCFQFLFLAFNNLLTFIAANEFSQNFRSLKSKLSFLVAKTCAQVTFCGSFI